MFITSRTDASKYKQNFRRFESLKFSTSYKSWQSNIKTRLEKLGPSNVDWLTVNERIEYEKIIELAKKSITLQNKEQRIKEDF